MRFVTLRELSACGRRGRERETQHPQSRIGGREGEGGSGRRGEEDEELRRSRPSLSITLNVPRGERNGHRLSFFFPSIDTDLSWLRRG